MKHALFTFVLGALALSLSLSTACNLASTSISSCHDSCDKMDALKCGGTSAKNQCYDDCDQATTDGISGFNGCAATAACDPSCRNKVAPFGRVPTGASADQCTQACTKLGNSCGTVALADVPVCGSNCQKDAYQFQVDCVLANDCATAKTACGDPTQLGAPKH
jgi:hypothetical protein